VNDVARQAGANPIALPSDNPSAAPAIAGETSPTGVPDLSLYPSWTDAKEVPSWYAKGADVDALLDVGDSLDWLADSGDLNETYQPPPPTAGSSISISNMGKAHGALGRAGNNTSVSSLPHVDANVESVVPPLPALFAGTEPMADNDDEKNTEDMISSTDALPSPAEDEPDAIAAGLKATASVTSMIEEHLQVFENPMEEQDFVSTILEEEHDESAASLEIS